MLGNVKVIATWTGASGNELTSGHMQDQYSARLWHQHLRTYISTNVFIVGNTGTYTCQAHINPSGSLMFIDRSNGVEAQITDIQRKLVAMQILKDVLKA